VPVRDVSAPLFLAIPVRDVSAPLFLAITNTPSEDLFQLESCVEVSMNIDSETKETN
jgi:hypothetical protein